MRTSPPELLPLFRSEMQVRLLGLLLLQPGRTWTLQELARTLAAPLSSVHRELKRAEDASIVVRDDSARPHRYWAGGGPLSEPLTELLRRSVGVEDRLRNALAVSGVDVALIHGSWARGGQRPDSDIDVLVVGNADLRDLRRAVRPIGKEAGRRIDLTLFGPEEFQQMISRRSSLAKKVMGQETIPLVGSLRRLSGGDRRQDPTGAG